MNVRKALHPRGNINKPFQEKKKKEESLALRIA